MCVWGGEGVNLPPPYKTPLITPSGGGAPYVTKLTSDLSFAIHPTIVTSLFLLMSAYFCWRQQKFQIGLSREPLMIEKWLTPRWKGIMKLYSKSAEYLTCHEHFCWHQHFYAKMTSRDVTWRHHIGLSLKHQKMFLFIQLSYGANMKSFASSKRKLCATTYFHFNMGIYRKILPTPDKKPISSLLDMVWT